MATLGTGEELTLVSGLRDNLSRSNKWL
jgi:hypothetical protein